MASHGRWCLSAPWLVAAAAGLFLLEAKKQIPHGRFLTFVNEKCTFTSRIAGKQLVRSRSSRE